MPVDNLIATPYELCNVLLQLQNIGTIPREEVELCTALHHLQWCGEPFTVKISESHLQSL